MHSLEHKAGLYAPNIQRCPKIPKWIKMIQNNPNFGYPKIVAKPHLFPMPCVSWDVSKALKVETKDAGSGLGTGGMSTKILAARTASVSGAGRHR
jgi:hypothetical protein